MLWTASNIVLSDGIRFLPYVTHCRAAAAGHIPNPMTIEVTPYTRVLLPSSLFTEKAALVLIAAADACRQAGDGVTQFFDRSHALIFLRRALSGSTQEFRPITRLVAMTYVCRAQAKDQGDSRGACERPLQACSHDLPSAAARRRAQRMVRISGSWRPFTGELWAV